jgi:hypothetical protein
MSEEDREFIEQCRTNYASFHRAKAQSDEKRALAIVGILRERLEENSKIGKCFALYRPVEADDADVMDMTEEIIEAKGLLFETTLHSEWMIKFPVKYLL